MRRFVVCAVALLCFGGKGPEPIWDYNPLTPAPPKAPSVKAYNLTAASNAAKTLHQAGVALPARVCTYKESYAVRVSGEDFDTQLEPDSCVDTDSYFIKVAYDCAGASCTSKPPLMRKLTWGTQVKYRDPYYGAGWWGLLPELDQKSSAGVTWRGSGLIAYTSKSKAYRICGNNVTIITDRIGPKKGTKHPLSGSCEIIGGKKIEVEGAPASVGTYKPI